MRPSPHTRPAAGPHIGTGFVPVHDPSASAAWYVDAIGLRVRELTEWSAVLDADGDTTLTLMGPASGIRAAPGLAWATHNIVVADLGAARARLAQAGGEPGQIEGDQAVCRFFTAHDPDGNVLLICDR